MKNKKTKAFLYQNLYPINLYVALIDDWDDVNNFFDFFITTDNLRNDEVNGGPSKPVNASAATYLVREKNTRAIGILILIGDYSSSTLAHESIHYADAVYDFLKMNAEGYNEGNEQYAYLVTWCVEQLDDYIQYRNKRKVK
ncbi:hypothetical protein [uncultured phage cr50_1]|jgi:hypothetical protein|uniref:Uncharacterized protein n=1 Tax=uncultured phage cr50_1 TaxID=2772059 RepID=A0A7M1RUP2_9CAUD|nr:hypothetical protein KNV26_gp029 [uncultured phage cr50_1]QOR58006.1 hypothetical protein [uncultured phage cr50_1]